MQWYYWDDEEDKEQTTKRQHYSIISALPNGGPVPPGLHPTETLPIGTKLEPADRKKRTVLNDVAVGKLFSQTFESNLPLDNPTVAAALPYKLDQTVYARVKPWTKGTAACAITGARILVNEDGGLRLVYVLRNLSFGIPVTFEAEQFEILGVASAGLKALGMCLDVVCCVFRGLTFCC